MYLDLLIPLLLWVRNDLPAENPTLKSLLMTAANTPHPSFSMSFKLLELCTTSITGTRHLFQTARRVHEDINMLQLIQPAARLVTQEKTAILFSVLIIITALHRETGIQDYFPILKVFIPGERTEQNKVSQNEVKGKSLGKEQVMGPV